MTARIRYVNFKFLAFANEEKFFILVYKRLIRDTLQVLGAPTSGIGRFMFIDEKLRSCGSVNSIIVSNFFYKFLFNLTICLFSSDIEITVDFLTEVDKLIQLLESPIFTCTYAFFYLLAFGWKILHFDFFRFTFAIAGSEPTRIDNGSLRIIDAVASNRSVSYVVPPIAKFANESSASCRCFSQKPVSIFVFIC